MTVRLHEVLEDIASDVRPVDLTQAVSARASRIRWVRRGIVGGTALGVAATVALVTVVLPAWNDSSRPDRQLPATRPSVTPLADGVDLDAAGLAPLESTSALVVVNGDDGAERAVAVDLRTGAATALGVEVPPAMVSAELSTTGDRALLVGAAEVVAVDLTTGDFTSFDRTDGLPFALTADGSGIFTVVKAADAGGVEEPAQWQLIQIDLDSGLSTPTPYVANRNQPPAAIWPAPSGDHVFVRFVDASHDQRTHRIDLRSGQVTYSEPYTSLKISALRWSVDGSMIAAEMGSSVRVLNPTDEIGTLHSTVPKIGIPLGFAAPDQLVWQVPIPDGAEIVLTDLTGATVGQPTRLLTAGSISALAIAL